jgi:hypothetical protein
VAISVFETRLALAEDGYISDLLNHPVIVLEQKKSLMVYPGLGSWYDGVAYVTVVGTVADFDNPDDFNFVFDGFTIECLERVEPIGFGLTERVFYTAGRRREQA